MATAVTLAFAAIAVVAWFLWQRGVDEATPPRPREENVDRTPAATASDGARAAAEARVAATTGTQRPFPPDAQWFPVRVIDKATQRPVPGATVSWYDGACGKEYFASLAHEEPDPALESLEQRALAFGWQTTTDDAGIARLASSEGFVEIAATHEGSYGELSLFENSVRPTAGVVLEIVPDHTLRVRVLDDGGAPAANVPIGFGACEDTGQPSHVSTTTTTDANGLAEFRHLQNAVAGHRVSRHAFHTAWSGPLGVFALVPGNRTPGVVLTELDPPPAAPVELRLPPHGSIVVRLAAIAADMPPVAVLLYEAEDKSRNRAFDVEQRTDASSSVRFDQVGLNRRFTVETTPSHWPETEIDGPRVAGQEVVVELRPDDTLVRAVGRLILAPGQPAANQDVEVTETRSDWTKSPSTIRTDGDGRFVLMRSAPRNNQEESRLRFECTSPDMANHRAETRRLLRPGLVDLGDLVTSRRPILCSGRLVAKGAPFRKSCDLSVEHFDTTDSSWKWKPVQIWLAADGTFAVTGDDQGTRVRLRVSGVALPKEPIEFTAGATGLVIEVDPGSTIAATLRVPEAADWSSLRVRLVPEPPLPEPDSNEYPSRWWADLYASSGQSPARRHAWWAALAAGSYTFEVWLLATGAPIVRIPGIRVPAATSDERLHDIDLRTALTVVRPRLLDENGVLKDADYVMAAAESAEDRLAAFASDRGIVLPTTPVDLTILVNGYRPTRAHFDGTRCDGKLTAWSTVDLSIGNPPSLPPAFEVRATITAIDPVEVAFTDLEGSQLKYRPYAPDDATHTVTGITRVPVGDGRSSLSIELKGPRRSLPLADATPRTIEPGTRAITVTVPEKAWAEALEQLRKD